MGLMILECIYRGLGLENKRLTDQLSLVCLIRQPYDTTTQVLDCESKTNKEVVKDQDMATLLGQLYFLAKKS